MERKTMREDRKHVSVFGDDAIYFSRDLPNIRKSINILAEYEDTGLTPEDFAASGQMEHFKEWREWHKADAEKRLVVLPCKVGDTVYSYSRDKKMRTLKCEGFLFTGICWKARCTDFIPSWVGNQKRHVYIMFSSFGKSAFLTREEAEAALAKDTNVFSKGDTSNED